MAERAEDAVPGLRERKKQRTRATLVDAAIELCLRNGYDTTTVEQIAAAADVSPRTFSRYFATKDAVFLTLIEDYSHEVAIALEAVPWNVGPLEALRQANVAILTRVSSGQVGRLTTERVILMLRVINASDALRRAAFEYRHEASEAILAKRMGVEVDDRRRRLVGAVFSSTIVTACGDLIADTDTIQLGPTVMVDRLNEAFAHVALFAADLPAAVAVADYEPVYV
ncbi:TetR/AcrR family transcriptional regulator [Mycobacterium sp. URHB0044]|uniref:TetR/AcrR family transcriptional regulator n=1 Tax=Mycobacterium sp. URHB0044 TaxID=1380386 RepID=UPI0007E8D253|nr:TetR family transcriptional regulator [Mycobacterium sp. URHB0044]